jgi:hypothetical protein
MHPRSREPGQVSIPSTRVGMEIAKLRCVEQRLHISSPTFAPFPLSLRSLHRGAPGSSNSQENSADVIRLISHCHGLGVLVVGPCARYASPLPVIPVVWTVHPHRLGKPAKNEHIRANFQKPTIVRRESWGRLQES